MWNLYKMLKRQAEISKYVVVTNNCYLLFQGIVLQKHFVEVLKKAIVEINQNPYVIFPSLQCESSSIAESCFTPESPGFFPFRSSSVRSKGFVPKTEVR